LVEEKGKVF